MASAALSSACAVPSLKKYDGLRASSSVSMVKMATKSTKRSLSVRCDYIGSSTNLIVAGSTALFLVAGRFGLAPSANRIANAGLKLSDRETGLDTRDPAGFTGTDVLAFGAVGHIFGVGVVLGLKALGSL